MCLSNAASDPRAGGFRNRHTECVPYILCEFRFFFPNSMNLPPDKARLLRQYDNEKKWELICDQERFQVKNPPHTYIQKLRSYLDPAVTRKKFRRRVQESTQVLRELEISLRTNHIGWVREFLNEENKGLDVLVEYLSFAQYAVTFDGDCAENNLENNSVDKSKPWSRSIEDFHGGGGTLPSNGSGISRGGRQSSTLRTSNLRRALVFCLCGSLNASGVCSF
ncbi:unnamed protein product [Boreogadus saida]